MKDFAFSDRLLVLELKLVCTGKKKKPGTGELFVSWKIIYLSLIFFVIFYWVGGADGYAWPSYPYPDFSTGVFAPDGDLRDFLVGCGASFDQGGFSWETEGHKSIGDYNYNAYMFYVMIEGRGQVFYLSSLVTKMTGDMIRANIQVVREITNPKFQTKKITYLTSFQLFFDKLHKGFSNFPLSGISFQTVTKPHT